MNETDQPFPVPLKTSCLYTLILHLKHRPLFACTGLSDCVGVFAPRSSGVAIAVVVVTIDVAALGIMVDAGVLGGFIL
jgi:hypothetical protein